jgi:6-phosphogluconolactonase (cycloisomerase 2 family)
MFSISADGHYFFVANQKSGIVSVLRCDPDTGALSAPCCEVAVPAVAYAESKIL